MRRPGLRENIAGVRPIGGLLAAVAVSRSALMLFPFYGVYLASDRHELTIGTIGLIVGMFGIGSLVADVTSGALAARLAEKRLAITGFLGVTCTVLAISISPELWMLVGLTAIWGFCYELVNPIAYTMVARAMPEANRRFAFSTVRLAINLGMGSGPVLAGILLKFSPSLLPWGTAIGYLAAAFILARARIVPLSDVEDEPAAAVASNDSGSGQHEMRFWSFIAATTPIHLAYALPPTVGSVYVIHTLDKPAGWVSAIFALNALMVITFEIALNHSMLGLTRRATLLIGYACATIGFGLMGLGAIQTWLLLVATAVWTLGEMIIYPVMPDHISAISPNRLKARNMGFYTAHYNLGVVFAPLIFLPLIDKLGPIASWSLVGALLLTGLLTTAVISNLSRIWGRDKVQPAPVLVDA